MTAVAEKTLVQFPPHLSHSQVSSIQTCGWRYVLEKALHVPQQPSWATVGGSAVHTATEVWDNWTLSGEWVTDRTEIEKLFNESFDKSIEERLQQEPDFTKDQWRASGRASKAWPNKENEEWWRANGPSQVMSWVTWRSNNMWEIAMLPDPGTGEAIPGIELECTPEIGGAKVKQFIDRVLTNKEQTELLVVDLKSGARDPDSAQQIGSYGAGLEQTFGVSATWGAYWMSRSGGTTPFVDMRLWPLVRLDDIYRKADEIRSRGLFLAKESSMCSGCSVRQYCFAVNGELSDTVPTPWEVEVEPQGSSS